MKVLESIQSQAAASSAVSLFAAAYATPRGTTSFGTPKMTLSQRVWAVAAQAPQRDPAPTPVRPVLRQWPRVSDRHIRNALKPKPKPTGPLGPLALSRLVTFQGPPHPDQQGIQKSGMGGRVGLRGFPVRSCSRSQSGHPCSLSPDHYLVASSRLVSSFRLVYTVTHSLETQRN